MTSERGCGRRSAGACYITVGSSPYGKALEEYIVDPPKVIPYKELGVAPIGIKIVKFPGRAVHDVIDWVGSSHYPNVADVIEEARAFLARGENPISRRISRNEDFAKLEPGSMLILMHSQAHIENYPDVVRKVQGREMLDCVTGKLTHARCSGPELSEMCASLWHHVVVGGTPLNDGTAMVGRSVGSTQYVAYPAPEGVAPKGVPAVFAAFPISGIEIVKGRTEAQDEENISRVSKGGLEFEVVRD